MKIKTIDGILALAFTLWMHAQEGWNSDFEAGLYLLIGLWLALALRLVIAAPLLKLFCLLLVGPRSPVEDPRRLGRQHPGEPVRRGVFAFVGVHGVQQADGERA